MNYNVQGRQQPGQEKRYFLEQEESTSYLPVFRNIRLPHLINHHMDVAMLVSDRIVPDSWMSSTYYTRWMTLLRLDSGRLTFVIMFILVKLMRLTFQLINLQALTKVLKTLMKKLSTENVSDAAEPSTPMVRMRKDNSSNFSNFTTLKGVSSCLI